MRNEMTDSAISQPHTSLSRWDSEGGAGHSGSQTGSAPSDGQSHVPSLTDAELIHLRIRVIALENLVIALLADGPERQSILAHEMAAHISPRPGYTPHALTIQAASLMIDLAKRAQSFRAA